MKENKKEKHRLIGGLTTKEDFLIASAPNSRKKEKKKQKPCVIFGKQRGTVGGSGVTTETGVEFGKKRNRRTAFRNFGSRPLNRASGKGRRGGNLRFLTSSGDLVEGPEKRS